MQAIRRDERIDQLLKLSHELGREDRQLAILGEGNTSVQLSANTFAVKASGCHLGNLRTQDVVECKISALLSLLRRTTLPDKEIDEALLESRLKKSSKKPSVEALFHAYLLSLPDVDFVGHTHSVAVNQVLCSPRAREFAEKRIFPDEIVCCGPASIFVPYTDPGLRLAQAIEKEIAAFLQKHQQAPRVILIENHGLIALGKTPEAVLAATLMANKAAQIWIGAAALGGPKFMTPEQVERIANRQDEAYRRRELKI